jgi:hypothetical protein
MNARLYLIVIGVVFLMLYGNRARCESLIVRYPAVQDPYYSERDIYFVKLLEMALSESGVQYDLRGIKYPSYSENRSVLFLKNKSYDVHWLNTTVEREAEVEAIKIPLYKGVIGWRAFFIKEGRQEKFDVVKVVDDLHNFVFVQGHDWADIEILKNGGLKVEGSSNWLGLFKMIALERADIFPRSIVEIMEEKTNYAEGLDIENELILQYPSAYYFFVNKQNTALKAAIEMGLKKIVSDGRLDRLFFDTFHEKISALNIENRKVLSIGRPSLQESMPLDEKELWFSIEWYRQAKQKYLVTP